MRLNSRPSIVRTFFLTVAVLVLPVGRAAALTPLSHPLLLPLASGPEGNSGEESTPSPADDSVSTGGTVDDSAGGQQGAKPAPTPSRGKPVTVRFFVEPLLGKGFGGTSYDLSFDAGGGVTGMSRLEFPRRNIEAGAALGISIERNGRQEWLVEASATYSVLPISATMYDYDWWQPEGYPRVPFSYTESDDSNVSWSVSLGVARTIAARGPWTAALYAGYEYSHASHREDTILGWQYTWNSTAGAYDLSIFGDPTLDVLEYDLSCHTLGVGLRGTWQPTKLFSAEAQTCLAPVYISDSDDHVLRTRIATASGAGIGATVALRGVFHFDRKLGASSPYLAVDGELSLFSVRTTQSQYWYGDADAANGAPRGTRVTGVGDTIAGARTRLGLGVGFAF